MIVNDNHKSPCIINNNKLYLANAFELILLPDLCETKQNKVDVLLLNH